MKAEINNENKAKFFTQYWGQKIVAHEFIGAGSNACIGSVIFSKLDNWHLELKPISSISVEDARSLGYKTCNDPSNANYGMSASGVFLDENDHMDEFLTSDADFLRSRGYLVPWMGLTCEELIEAGWAKCKE